MCDRTNNTPTLIEWLSNLQIENFEDSYLPPTELMHYAQALQSFLYQHWVKGEQVYIENF